MLPLRKNVAIVLVKDDKVLIVNKVNWPSDFWKLPQGGLDGDDVITGGLRELKEELGVTSVEVIGVSKFTNEYDWDPSRDKDLIERHGARGQTQQFLVLRFVGNEKEIKPDMHEIEKYRWAAFDEIKDMCNSKKMLMHHYGDIVVKVIEEFFG